MVLKNAPNQSQSQILVHSAHRKTDKNPTTTVLHNLAAEIWPTNPPAIPCSTKNLQKIGTAATRALRRIHKHAVAEREAFLQELKARRALHMSAKDADAISAIKTIDRQLTSGRRFHRIAHALKPATSATLAKVKIISTESSLHPVTGITVSFNKVRVIDTRKALEDAIIARNKKHFAQADGTPFTQQPFVRINSENGYNVYSDANGNDIQVLADFFVETKTVMNILCEHLREDPMRWSDEVSFDDFISGFLHWNKQTATSPSGRHLGMYGALVTVYCNSSGEFSDGS
jgi:hypothetical protein